MTITGIGGSIVTTIVSISDTHGQHQGLEVPDGDILIHAGDFSSEGDLRNVDPFNKWLGSFPHEHKIFVPGNHDFCFEAKHNQEKAIERLTAADVLIDEALTVEGLKIWGSPWQPEFFDWAFNLPRGEALREKWEKIPDDVDVLVTHGPPYGMGDFVPQSDLRVGCQELLDAVRRVDPIVHIYGHIHEGYGTYNRNDTKFINASICDGGYQPSNEPIVSEVANSPGV